MRRKPTRSLRLETLERREVFAAGFLVSNFFASRQNAVIPADVNNDSVVTPLDALLVINELSRQSRGELAPEPVSESKHFFDTSGDGLTTPLDVLHVLNALQKIEVEAAPVIDPVPLSISIDPVEPVLALDDESASFSLAPFSLASVQAEEEKLPLNETASFSLLSDPGKAPGVGDIYQATFNNAETANSDNLLTQSDVETLLSRASMASKSQDAIIAIVDRSGRILGVRVEAGVNAALQNNAEQLAFAIDGAVAKARTAAFFSSNSAPLTSRTIRFISQSTVTQREVESWPMAADPRYNGPGLVAPIGVGGHFPPQTNFTPQVDLFAIEHQSRDSQTHAGADGVKGTGDDFTLENRFNANGDFVPAAADEFFNTWPESYGAVTGTAPNLQARGIATLPGGVPLFKTVVDANGNPVTSPVSATVNLVGGIGVFFPGELGYATHEQNFIHSSLLKGKTQTEAARTNASKVIEAEFIALAAAAGRPKSMGGEIVGAKGFTRDLSFVNSKLPAAPRFVALNGRIDLVGITLEIYGPTPTRANKAAGIDQVLALGKKLGTGVNSFGINGPLDVNLVGDKFLAGQPVPEGWLVAPHASAQAGGLTAADVEQIIVQGIASANATRAAIRLDVDNNFRPGARTKMVLAVTDTNGELLGLFRMPDATVFSIDVAVSKARNTAYYADPEDLQATDRIDFNNDGIFGTVSTSTKVIGDTLPLGTALTNRTFRFLVEPRYPTGGALPKNAAVGLVNNANLTLRDQKANVANVVGPESILQMPGINPVTAENLDRNNPLPVSVYTDPATATILAFDSFVPTRNFRDPGDAEVVINGTGVPQPLANQNGIVFFPSSTPLYATGSALIGGFGVSGDGVDQDDVVTAAGQVGYAAPQSIRVDQFLVGKVRLPFQKFNRNPLGK
jgi:uncharacterized protein GlcG (DUF336 family)